MSQPKSFLLPAQNEAKRLMGLIEVGLVKKSLHEDLAVKDACESLDVFIRTSKIEGKCLAALNHLARRIYPKGNELGREVAKNANSMIIILTGLHYMP